MIPKYNKVILEKSVYHFTILPPKFQFSMTFIIFLNIINYRFSVQNKRKFCFMNACFAFRR